MVECLHNGYRKFPPESVSERILEIGEDLRKLLPKVWWLPFRLGGDFFVFSVIHVSQGSVATYVMCGGIST